MVEILNSILREQLKTNQLLEKMTSTKNEEKVEELLTAKEVQEQYGLSERTVYMMFNDKDFAVLRYTKPMKATRKAINEYLLKRHEKVE